LDKHLSFAGTPLCSFSVSAFYLAIFVIMGFSSSSGWIFDLALTAPFKGERPRSIPSHLHQSIAGQLNVFAHSPVCFSFSGLTGSD